MAVTLRTFIGIRILSTPELEAIGREIARLGRGLNVTSADKLHLTMKFLGDTRPEQLPAIMEAVKQGAGAAHVHRIELTAFGAFPNAARPDVVWVGIQPPDELRRLTATLDASLQMLGFVPESRPFHPHLTLARVKGPVPGLREFIAAHADTGFGSALIDRLELFQSDLTPQGSRYTSLATSILRQQG